jgi:hypothetical protein
MLEKAARSALLLLVFSPSWVESKEGWTLRELKAFCEAAPAYGRIFIAEILPVEEKCHPSAIKDNLRTPFYWYNEKKVPVTATPHYGPEDDPQKFTKDLINLSHHIVEQLKRMRGAASIDRSRQSTITGKTVLLARVPEDLRSISRDIRSYLIDYGVKVLPEHEFPEADREFGEAFKSELTKNPGGTEAHSFSSMPIPAI